MRYPILALVTLVGGYALTTSGRADEGRGRARFAARSGRYYNVTAPLRVELTPLPRRKGDEQGQRRLRVQVTPLVDAAGLEVKLVLPPGMKLVRGQVHWQAPARARGTQSRELLLEVPAAGEQQVVATARLVFHRSLPMARTVAYTFNPKAVQRRPKGELKEPERLPTIRGAAPARGK